MKIKLFLIHGAFQGGFVWKSFLPRLQAFDYEVFAPTLVGNTLSEHINQICHQISELPDERVALVGHSYGSLVVTGVAKALPDRISGLTYLDAPLPTHPDGAPQSLLDILGPDVEKFFRAQTTEGTVAAFPPASFGLDPEVHGDIIAQHAGQALGCFTEKGASWHPNDRPAYPVSYIQCAPNEFTDAQVAKASTLNFNVSHIPDSGHCPMITHPGELLRVMNEEVFPQMKAFIKQQETCASDHAKTLAI
ncbi:MAG: alpha/beta hydrolase [Gammaproteobacteria bacterium]|nr:alpha/beta hydrolase [Gammaproteobacteria bacterium]